MPSNYLAHIGVKRRSGRYPWGSGKDPYQHSGDFLSRMEELEKAGYSKADRIKKLGLENADQYDAYKWICQNERREMKRQSALAMKERGMNTTEIAKALGYPNESSVRNLLKEDASAKYKAQRATVDLISKEVKNKGIVDIGEGVELSGCLGISKTKLNQAVEIAMAENGYVISAYQLDNPTDPNSRKKTTVKVLCRDEDIEKQGRKDPSLIKNLGEEYTSDDNGETYRKVEYPSSLDSKRVAILHGDEYSKALDGKGEDFDGAILIRRGVKDLNLGDSAYAQARILVDGTHYLKGMALYSDDIPDGKDVLFCTNKKKGTDMKDVLKKIKDDPDNPFGATLTAKGQSTYIDADGNIKLSPINKLKSEGEWDTGSSKNLSSQFLSKQPVKLIKQQLGISKMEAEDQLNEIKSISNPAVRRRLLEDYANDMDSKSWKLKAAALPRQRTQVLLPLSGIKDNEIFAPNFKDGETVCLIRYPHASITEIPELKVNNNNPSGKRMIGKNAKDAVGINSKVAARLSGADFDGDFVVVIPKSAGANVKNAKPYPELVGFDPKDAYSTYPGKDKKGRDCRVNKYGDKVKIMTEAQKQIEMGKVSNLITDMTLSGAKSQDIAKAMKHSMCVIDCVKHKLDYRKSERENDISRLKKTYQGEGGAKTLISKRKKDIKVKGEIVGSPHTDPKTGELSYNLKYRQYEEMKLKKITDPVTGKKVTATDKHGKPIKIPTGKIVDATHDEKLLLSTKDLHTLSSGTKQEELYADYGNKLKSLANEARKEKMATGTAAYSKEANQKYAKEVSELNSALNVALKNKPKERQAKAIANAEINRRIKENPDLSKDDIKKLRQNVINKSRAEVGADGRRTKIDISDKQWEAIENGALSDAKISKIFGFADMDKVKKYALPSEEKGLRDSQISRLKAMRNGGYSNEEISSALGISVSTVTKYLNE